MGYWIDREKDPGEHLAVYDDLWKRLVPAKGPAETAQGEMIRSAARLASEYYRNGDINWSGRSRKFYIGFVDYIERTIAEHGPSHFVERAGPCVRAVRAIGLSEANESDYDFDPWDGLIHVVVEWCLAHPELLPAVQVRESPR